jgi:hypothetical protein
LRGIFCSVMRRTRSKQMADPINPQHYRTHPSSVECITVTEHMNFCLGNAVKYIWRAGQKGDIIEDLKKARWYLDREIERLGHERATISDKQRVADVSTGLDCPWCLGTNGTHAEACPIRGSTGR